MTSSILFVLSGMCACYGTQAVIAQDWNAAGIMWLCTWGGIAIAHLARKGGL